MVPRGLWELTLPLTLISFFFLHSFSCVHSMYVNWEGGEVLYRMEDELI